VTGRDRPAPRLDAAHRDALIAFVRGYLHEDVLAEYGSAEGAAHAFAQDASEAERRLVAEALEHVGSRVQSEPAQQIGGVFRDEFRSAWMPSSGAEVLTLARALRKPRPRRMR